MNNQSPLDKLLNLSGISVAGYQVVEGYVWLELKILNQEISCPYCEKNTQELHQTKFVSVRDLPRTTSLLKSPKAKIFRSFLSKICDGKIRVYPMENVSDKKI